jgi:hypothetical protein
MACIHHAGHSRQCLQRQVPGVSQNRENVSDEMNPAVSHVRSGFLKYPLSPDKFPGTIQPRQQLPVLLDRHHFTPAMLHRLEAENKVENLEDRTHANEAINQIGYDAAFTEYGSYQVKVEKSYETPVQSANQE